MYGMWFDPGFGYHVDNTTGIATGNEPESIYAVMSGKNFNGGVPHAHAGISQPTTHARAQPCLTGKCLRVLPQSTRPRLNPAMLE